MFSVISVAKKEKMPPDRLIIFTRYPDPGMTKTRLIPALGPEGAANLHRRMSEHTLAWARLLQTHSPVSVEVRYAGRDANLLRQWLGPDFFYRDQGKGDLGERMVRAIAEAFQSGGERIILVGTDCPGLTDGLVRTAFASLVRNDLVLGPAKDGGYYLIGVRRVIPQLFSEIPWGTSEVLEKTLRIADQMQLRVFLLEPLDDVDRPSDLPVWEGFMRRDFPLISIIIPTLNEEKNIAACLTGTLNAPNVERIVVDGGSHDLTVEIARSCGAKVLTSPAGRARQMNAGAEVASGDLLLFLHADTLLPEGFDDCVRRILTQPGVAAGAFEFRLDAVSRGLQIIERVANWRSRRLQMPYGDQAIFVRSSLFQEIGGFPKMPILEDFELIRRLKKKGRIHTLPLPAITSARRWHTLGIWQTTLSHQLIVAAYYLGLSPALIHRFARRNR